MSTQASLPQSVRYGVSTTINFTGRSDLGQSDWEYGLADGGSEFRYAINIAPGRLAKLAAVDPDGEVSVVFRKPNGYSTVRRDHGTFAAFVRRGGRITGTIPATGLAEDLTAVLIVSDPEDARILVTGSKSRPDEVIHEDVPEDQTRPDKVQPKVTRPDQGMSLVAIKEDADVTGFWDVTFDGPAVLLIVHPDLGKARFENDPMTQAIVLPEVVRRVLTEMAVNESFHKTSRWWREWMVFATELSPTGHFAYFQSDWDGETESERPDPQEFAEAVGLGVQKFISMAALKMPRMRLHGAEEE